MRLLFVLAAAVLFSDCYVDRVQAYEYRLLNASDHVVDIKIEEVEKYSKSFPAELTLLPGEDFFWENPVNEGTVPAPFWWNTGRMEETTTFDHTYTVSHFEGKSLFDGYSYVIEDRMGRLPLATYTLTNADYEYAVEHGKVVE